jgi:hypothetical protein
MNGRRSTRTSTRLGRKVIDGHQTSDDTRASCGGCDCRRQTRSGRRCGSNGFNGPSVLSGYVRRPDYLSQWHPIASRSNATRQAPRCCTLRRSRSYIRTLKSCSQKCRGATHDPRASVGQYRSNVGASPVLSRRSPRSYAKSAKPPTFRPLFALDACRHGGMIEPTRPNSRSDKGAPFQRPGLTPMKAVCAGCDPSAPSHVPWQPLENAAHTSSSVRAKNKGRSISQWYAEKLSE